MPVKTNACDSKRRLAMPCLVIRMFRVSSLLVVLPFVLAGCTKESDEDALGTKAMASSAPEITAENYARAETEIIFGNYVRQIAAATQTNGTGQWLHRRAGADPASRTIMRINFDTLYSIALLDLTEEAVLTMPETQGRYQSAWLITTEHYNPLAFVRPGRYEITQEAAGSRFVLVVIRTQVNLADPADVATVHALQNELALDQANKGAFKPSAEWDREAVLTMRTRYAEIGRAQGLTSEVMFGKKGEVSLEAHNVGTAMGWGGLTPERAVYPTINADSTEPQRLTLRDVPAGVFWSITVYDDEGFVQGEKYNINSAFAVANEDGSHTIHFGGDKGAVNYLDIFAGWSLMLRIYEPTDAYFSGDWVMPELEPIEP